MVFVVAFARIDIAANFNRRAPEVKIVLIETGNLLQPLDVEQGEPPARQRNKFSWRNARRIRLMCTAVRPSASASSTCVSGSWIA